MTKTYPYSAWTLSPSFKPKLVTLVRPYGSVLYGDIWDVAESGKSYSVAHELFPSRGGAISAGWERIHAQEAKLDKQYTVLDKKRAALAKAALDAPSPHQQEASGLAEGFDGSAVRPGPNHSTIEIWYATEAQARAAHKVIVDLIEASAMGGEE